MRDHINIVAYLYIGLGILGILGGLIALVTLMGAGAISGDGEAALITGGIGLFVALLAGVLSLPAIIGGYGVLQRKEWGRILVMVLSAINLFNVPIGTAIGGYALYVLTRDDVKVEF